MNEYTYTDNGHTFRRVNKTIARKVYNNGLRVVLCPCNLRPGYPWHPEISISGKSGADFETQLNSFEYYNLNKDAGRRTSYYIPVTTVDSFTGEPAPSMNPGTMEVYDYSYVEQL